MYCLSCRVKIQNRKMEKLKRIIFQMDYLKRQELFFPQTISILCYLAKRKVISYSK